MRGSTHFRVGRDFLTTVHPPASDMGLTFDTAGEQAQELQNLFKRMYAYRIRLLEGFFFGFAHSPRTCHV